MLRIVLFHYNRMLREQTAELLRQRGCLAYAAASPEDAWRAARTLKPDVVVTDFPALVETMVQPRMTLSEAVKTDPDLKHVRVLSVGAVTDPHIIEVGAQAGVEAWLSAETPAIIAARLCSMTSELEPAP